MRAEGKRARSTQFASYSSARKEMGRRGTRHLGLPLIPLLPFLFYLPASLGIIRAEKRRTKRRIFSPPPSPLSKYEKPLSSGKKKGGPRMQRYFKPGQIFSSEGVYFSLLLLLRLLPIALHDDATADGGGKEI